MAFFDDMFKGGNIGSSLAVALGIAVVGPLLTPVIGGILRPVTKAVVKAGLLAYDVGREGFERLNEASGDIVGEVRAELDHDRRTQAGTRAETIAERRPAGATA